MDNLSRGMMLAAAGPKSGWKIVQISPIPATLTGLVIIDGTLWATSSSGFIASTIDGVNWDRANTGITTTMYFLARSSTIYVAVGNSGVILTSTDGATWTSQTSGVTTALLSVSWNGSQFVAVGNSGVILTSTDAVTWTSQTSGVTTALNSIIWGNSQFVTVGSGGVILTSTDAVTWTSQTSGVTSTLSFITFLNNFFIAVGNSGVILTSTDAVTWTSRTSGVTSTLYQPIWDGARYLIGTSTSNTLLTSTDLVSWSTLSLTLNLLFSIIYQRLTFFNNTYLFFGSNGSFVTSNDGISGNIKYGPTLNRVRYSPELDLFAAVGNDGAILTSSDGLTWTYRISNSSIGFYDLIWTQNKFIASGSTAFVFTSTDGITWTSNSTPTAFISVAANETTIVGVPASSSNLVYTSTDGGITWTSQSTGTISSFGTAIIWDGTNFIRNASNRISTSPDAVTWSPTLTYTPSIGYLKKIGSDVYAFGTDAVSKYTGSSSFSVVIHRINWLGVGYLSSIGKFYVLATSYRQTSSDGVNFDAIQYWSTTQTNAASSGYSIASNNDGSLIVITVQGYSNLYSVDFGQTWIRTSMAATNLFVSKQVIWDGNKFVQVGRAGTAVELVGTSTDGFTWTSIQHGLGGALESIVYTGSLYVACGVNGRIGTATNPTGTWTLESSGVTATLWFMVYTGTLFVAVGNSGTIVTSTDAVTWTSQTSGVTTALLGLVWSGSQFVAVGNSGVILTSTDAVTWTSQTSGTGYNLQKIAWNGITYVVCGSLGTILYSTDAVTWTSAYNSPYVEPYTAASLSEGELIDDEIYLVGTTGLIMNLDPVTNSAEIIPRLFTGSLNSITTDSQKLIAVGSITTIISGP